MPTSDGDAAVKDAEWHNRPDYAISAWLPDGVERDQARYARGLEVIRSNPGWFLGVMSRRAFFMLRYNDSSPADWPFNTSKVPIVSAEAPVMNSAERIDQLQPSFFSYAPDLLAQGSVLSRQAEVSLSSDSQSLRITGDASEFGDQFASAPIAVKPGTDYLLTLQTALGNGKAAAKVTSSDLRIALASTALRDDEAQKKPKEKKDRNKDRDSDAQVPMGLTQMSFASGDRSEVRFVISNNGSASARPVIEITKAASYALGGTPYQWSRYPRALIRGLQKNLFKTSRMLSLVIAGMILTGIAGRVRAIVALLAVPAYYLCVQSALSTEYRYILSIHYFLFVMGAVTLYSFAALIRQMIRPRAWRATFSGR